MSHNKLPQQLDTFAMTIGLLSHVHRLSPDQGKLSRKNEGKKRRREGGKMKKETGRGEEKGVISTNH